MAGIRLDNLIKKYGDVTVVQNLTLEVPDNEFLVLVGPSGCGKTTTLRMVAGLEEITSGDVYIGDRCVTNMSPKDRDIAMVFQNYALYPHMSVFENMALGLRNRRLGANEIERRINEATTFLGIEGFLRRKPRELSGGQRQRVALGRAIVREPQVFLMDEPLSNLDAQVRANTRIELLRIHQRIKNTVMYVTHDQVEAMTMGDRIVVMKDGYVQQVAAPKEIYDHPANRFVAGFIGSPAMNFVDAELETSGDGGVRLRGRSVDVSVNGGAGQKLQGASRRTVTLGIRPEDIACGDGAGATQAAISTRVEVVETLGAEQHLVLNTGETSLLARVAPDFPATTGQQLDARLNLAKLHVFDRESGAAYF